jgi:tetratricopeptide (TPR) repeat protein
MPKTPGCPLCRGNTHTAQTVQAPQPLAPAATHDDNSVRPVQNTEKPKHGAPAYVAWAVLREHEAANKSIDLSRKRDLYDQARHAYQTALQADPKYVPAYTGLANVYMKLNHYDKAKESYHTALKIAPNDPSLWFELGICHCRCKEFDQATGYLHKAMELDPENRFITQTLGFCLARSGHVKESLDLLGKVMTPVEVHYNVARMLYQIRRDDLALMHLQFAIQLDPAYEPATSMLAALRKGSATVSMALPPPSPAAPGNLFTPPAAAVPLSPPPAKAPTPAELEFE